MKFVGNLDNSRRNRLSNFRVSPDHVWIQDLLSVQDEVIFIFLCVLLRNNSSACLAEKMQESPKVVLLPAVTWDNLDTKTIFLLVLNVA